MKIWKLFQMKQSPEKNADFENFQKEINDLYKDLKEQNFSDEDIEKVFEPMFKDDGKWTNRDYIIFIIMSVVFYALIQTEFIYNNVSWYMLAISRILLIKIHPYYDWTYLKDQECLIPKWWEPKVTQNYTPNCNLCENLKKIYVFDNLSYSELTEFYLEIQKPVILTDDAWPNLDNFFASIIEDDFFLTSIPCSLQTNMIDGSTNVETIMDKIVAFPSFFVHFRNCEYESMKHFRKITPKPKFIPLSISPIQYNSLLWAKNYAFPKYKEIELIDSEDIKIIGQISGRLTFKLSPPSLCKKTCSNLEITLDENQFLVFTNFWKLKYKNMDNDVQDNVAVILEAHSLM